MSYNVSDPIADMLTRIRNAVMVRHPSVIVPSSRLNLSITRILRDEGFVGDYEVLREKPQRAIKIGLKYGERKSPVIYGLKRVSRPGLRVYVKRGDIPKVYGGLGIAIVSTSKGLMTGKEAWQKKLGGELLCYVW
ncbi:MAG: 30S ribosomal protein S8 [Chloroflexi bacterium]|nr:30S ribosomal protein S8 [Chloroflexota bacterium]